MENKEQPQQKTKPKLLTQKELAQMGINWELFFRSVVGPFQGNCFLLLHDVDNEIHVEAVAATLNGLSFVINAKSKHDVDYIS